MAILTDDMKRVVREQRLGFLATVCEDGNAQSLAKGTAAVCRFRGPAAVHDPAQMDSRWALSVCGAKVSQPHHEDVA